VITATDGPTSVKAVSLTRDDVGAYTLRDLPTPGTYTLVITHPGHTTTTLSVNLAAGGTRTGVDTTLVEGGGSISGRVEEAGVGPAGGVRVRATDGERVVETVTASVGDVGAYLLAGLAVPGTYTLSFERDDLAPQTRAVTLDRLTRRIVTGEDVSMTTATGTISGIVRDTLGDPVGNANVTLTGNGITLRTVSATDPAGQYRLTRVPPGTYSITFARGNAGPTALLATVAADQDVVLDAVLAARASIEGLVLEDDGIDPPVPLAGAVVRVYRQEDYPGGPAVRTTTTGADGTYRVTGLEAPAIYVLEFGRPGDPPVTSLQIPVEPGGEELVDPVTIGP
jgi:hypothetical protein